tara:strand:+ start:397 stop:1692 length:1296 start_codon:yes stop_codon:yes gene_type:complete
MINDIRNLYTNKDILTGFSLFAFFGIIYMSIFYLSINSGLISNSCISDECGYIQFAENIINGFYSPESPDINLWWGPGFPLFLVPFKLLGIQRQGIILVNIILHTLSISLMFICSRILIPYRISIMITSIWGFYYIHYPSVFSAHSEPLACILLLTSFYFYLLYTIQENHSYLISSSLLFGFLVLTKVIFSYVLLIILLLSLFVSLFKKRIISALSFSLIALILTIPYQIYTHQLTGKIFYFSNAGGESLYWMSTPHKGEFGEWNNSNFDANCNLIEDEIPCNKELYRKNHGKFYDELSKLRPIERDNVLKSKAITNIKKYPIKYIRNISSNISRMFFNIPNSYFYQRDITTTARLFPNSILLSLIFFSSLITIANFNKIPNAIKFYFLITAIYLFLSSLLSTYPRMLNITLPFVITWIAYSGLFWKEKSP